LTPDTDKDIWNAFINIWEDSEFWKKLHIAQSFI